jgi:type I restriction enzyme S subunit
MNLETFFEKFDLFAAAPNAVAKMRELVRQLAVQGRLVEQDQDEPVGDLLARIENAKERLIKRREIKRVSVEPNPTGGDDYGPLPSGWLWTRLGIAFDVRDGTHDTPKYTNEGFPLITSKNIYTGSLSFEGANLISEEDHRQIGERSRVDRGDILFATIGSIGNPVIVDTDREFSIKNVALFKYYAANEPERRFLLQYLKLASEKMRAKAAGGVQSFVSLSFLRNYPFPLPPLVEQKRIVAKMDELMALCDWLEAQQKERETRHAALARASLARFTTRARRPISISYSTDLTTSPPPTSEKLSSPFAIQGKLVPQDPKDEPAEILLCKIQKRCAELELVSGLWKRESQFSLGNGADESKPYSWKQVRIGELCLSIVPQRDKPLSFSGHIPWVTLPAFSENSLNLNLSSNCAGLSVDEVERYRLRVVPAGSVLMSCVGRFGLVALLDRDVVPNQQIHGFYFPTEFLDGRFLCYSIMAQKSYLEAQSTTTTISYLNKTKCESVPVGLPPLAEQRRIVAKVDELMALVDALQTQLTAARTTAERLMEAVVAELTNSGVIYAAIRNDPPGFSADQPNVLYRTEGPGAA